MTNKILFICQKEYFRASIYDALEIAGIDAYWVRSGDHNTIRHALEYSLQQRYRIVCVIRPEWLASTPTEVSKLKRLGTKLVGISSEPIQHNWQAEAEVHEDQLRRLANLKAVNQVPLDLLIHYDEASSTVIEKSIEHKTVYKQLPVAAKLFFPEPEGKVFDSIFLGRHTEYREDFLAPVKSMQNILHVAHGLTDEMARVFTCKAGVSLNIHNQNYLGFEIRVLQSLLCGVPVISEQLTRDDFDHLRGLKFVNTPAELWDTLSNHDYEKPDLEEVQDAWLQECNVVDYIRFLEENL